MERHQINCSHKQYLKKGYKNSEKNGKKITDPQKIVNLFNQHYANVGPNIDKKTPQIAEEIL